MMIAGLTDCPSRRKNAYIKEHPNSKFAKEMFDDIEDNQSRTEYKAASNKYHNYFYRKPLPSQTYGQKIHAALKIWSQFHPKKILL